MIIILGHCGEDFAKILMFLRASYIGTFLRTKFVSAAPVLLERERLPYPLFNSGSSILMAKYGAATVDSMLHS